MIDNASLAIAFQQGDHDAFTQVYEQYHMEVRKSIRRLSPTKLKSELDDICQYFWAQLFRYTNTYDPSRPLGPWLFIVAAKSVVSYYRAREKKKSLSWFDVVHPLLTDDDDGAKQNQAPGPVACAILKEDVAAVKQALKRIPERYGRPLEAIYLQGQTAKAFAQREKIAINTVYSRVNRGLQYMQKEMRNQEARCS